MHITGKITYVDLSGGFWGIVGDDGQKYFPSDGIPQTLQKEGLRVKASYTPSQGFSIFMWGKQVDIKQIERI